MVSDPELPGHFLLEQYQVLKSSIYHWLNALIPLEVLQKLYLKQSTTGKSTCYNLSQQGLFGKGKSCFLISINISIKTSSDD